MSEATSLTMAQVLMNGRDRIKTAWGSKSVYGVQDMIDRTQEALVAENKRLRAALHTCVGCIEGPIRCVVALKEASDALGDES